MSKCTNAQGLVLARVMVNSVSYKIVVLANGFSLNRVEWSCNDLDNSTGAIDRLTKGKESFFLYLL